MELLKKTAVFRIEQQTKDIPADEVRNISLSDVPVISERLICFPALTHLTLVSMKPRIKSLKELPLAELRNLRVLDVSDNAITITDDLPYCPSMKKLFIANNKISSWEELERLAASFTELEVLDATDNSVNEPERFNDIFSLFPQLVALDSKDSSGGEVIIVETDESSSESDDEEEDESDDDSFISNEDNDDEEVEEENEKNNKSEHEKHKRPLKEKQVGEDSNYSEDESPPKKLSRTESS